MLFNTPLFNILLALYEVHELSVITFWHMCVSKYLSDRRLLCFFTWYLIVCMFVCAGRGTRGVL